MGLRGKLKGAVRKVRPGRRHKCPVCGLYVWGKKAHTGPMHDRIMRRRK